MTTNMPSRKQVIILMNTKNRNYFMKDLNTNVSNINEALKNIKSEIIANFICLDSRSIIITTNKMLSILNLQTIEKYIRNINNIE